MVNYIPSCNTLLVSDDRRALCLVRHLALESYASLIACESLLPYALCSHSQGVKPISYSKHVKGFTDTPHPPPPPPPLPSPSPWHMNCLFDIVCGRSVPHVREGKLPVPLLPLSCWVIPCTNETNMVHTYLSDENGSMLTHSFQILFQMLH